MKKSNQSEIGNAMLKRKGKLWLVQAAQDDIAQHIQQGEQLLAFLSSSAPSTGRGPDQRQLDQRSRSLQMSQARDFAETLQSQEALAAEFAEVDNPGLFIPNANARHRPTGTGIQGKVQQKKRSAQKGGQQRKRQKKVVQQDEDIVGTQQTTAILTLLQDKDFLKKQMDLLMSQEKQREQYAQNTGQAQQPASLPFTPQRAAAQQQDASQFLTPRQGHTPYQGTPAGKPRVVTYKPNPPVVIEISGIIRKCIGCNNFFKRDKMLELPDLIFRLLAIRPWQASPGRWVEKEGNAYFHLNMTCLRSHNPSIQMKDIIIYDELFAKLKEEQKAQLQALGLLHLLSRGRQ